MKQRLPKSQNTAQTTRLARLASFMVWSVIGTMLCMAIPDVLSAQQPTRMQYAPQFAQTPPPSAARPRPRPRPMQPVGNVLPDGAHSSDSAPVAPRPAIEPTPPKAQSSTTSEGGAMLRASARQLTSYRSIQAKIRHQITMYGQQIRGVGAYFQQGQGDGLQLRMELKVPVGQQIASLQHVCDGRHLWMRKAMNSKVELQRVDLLRVRSAVGPDWRPGWQQAMLGGLPRLLGALADSFEFAPPRSMQWNGQRVWRMRGALRQTQGKQVNKSTADAPSHVEVILDQQSLFPYRVNYFAAISRDGEREMKPLVVIELYDVVIGDVIPSHRFVYEAENYRNATESFIAGLADKGE